MDTADPDAEPASPWQVQPHEWLRAQASLELARATHQPVRLAEALVELGRCARRAGLAQAAAAHFDEALGWAGLLEAPDLMADLACERGELAADAVAGTPSAPDRHDPIGLDAWLTARGCAAEAAALAARVSDPEVEVRLLLRASDLFDRLGATVEAGALQVRAMRRSGRAVETPAAAPRAIELQGHPTLQ